MYGTWKLASCGLLASLFSGTRAIHLDITSRDSVTNAASIAAANMLTFYGGNLLGGTPGLPLDGYYWWEAGAMFGQLIHHWHLTGNDTYNDLITQGMLWQIGENENYEPTNQTADLGNDDQAFWAYAALDAAELNFPNPPANRTSWLALAQAVYNRQVGRWDPETCNGGLRWQVFPFNKGYKYKNVAANGGLFQIAARLARYTGNSSYANTANMIWDWLEQERLVALDGQMYKVYDGASTDDNCTKSMDEVRWTYNHGTMLMGAAYMYNYTNGSTQWSSRLSALIYGTTLFFVREENGTDPNVLPAGNGNILTEYACEELTPQTCNQDQPAFKAFLARWYAVTMQLAPHVASTLYPFINASATAAAQQCTGAHGSTNQPATDLATGGTFCGRRWYGNRFDGYSGYGEQMAAMSIFQNVLIASSAPPFTTVTGGTSAGDVEAGNAPTDPPQVPYMITRPVTVGDLAGAWALTVFGFAVVGGVMLWMAWENDDGRDGHGADAGWVAPGDGGIYKGTAAYGAYRMAVLHTGGIYAKTGGMVKVPQQHGAWWGHDAWLPSSRKPTTLDPPGVGRGGAT